MPVRFGSVVIKAERTPSGCPGFAAPVVVPDGNPGHLLIKPVGHAPVVVKADSQAAQKLHQLCMGPITHRALLQPHLASLLRNAQHDAGSWMQTLWRASGASDDAPEGLHQFETYLFGPLPAQAGWDATLNTSPAKMLVQSLQQATMLLRRKIEGGHVELGRTLDADLTTEVFDPVLTQRAAGPSHPNRLVLDQ